MKTIGLFLCPVSIKIQAKITMAIPAIHCCFLEKNHGKTQYIPCKQFSIFQACNLK